MPKKNPTRRLAAGVFLDPLPGWIELIDRRFGRLVVRGFTGRQTRFNQKLITCECDCGWFVDVPPARLKNGGVTSCGCAFSDFIKEHNETLATHGHTRGGTVTPEYRAWQAMINRCHKPDDQRYKDYGARGIKVCKKWRASFEAFLVDVGRRPSALFSIDRIKNDGHYRPGNVRWATATTQNRNQRRTRTYEIDGVRRSLGEWCELYSTSYDMVLQRLDKYDWNLLDALRQPPGGGGRFNWSGQEDLYGRWYMMIDRCHNSKSLRYSDYGGRGIAVCEAWRASFETFCRDVGTPPSPQHTIDRKDPNGNYEPGNVRWATAQQQTRNRRNTKRYELAGRWLTLSEWADLAGLPYRRVKQRVLTYGWALDEALGTPVGGTGRMPAADRKKWKPPGP